MRIYLFLVTFLYCIATQAQPMLAFERDGFIWTAKIDGSKAQKVTEGYIPEISPDGKYIAYNIIDKSANRYLAIIELKSGKVTQLKNIPSANSFNPVWSPDGKTLLFNTFINDNWHLALVNTDGTGFHLIKNTQNEYSPAWAKNGTSFFSHDLDSIYWMDFKGSLIKKWTIHEIIPQGNMSSASRLHISPDGKTLIIDVDMNEAILKNWNEPPPALWTLNLESGKTTRISPKGIPAWSPFWINSEEFIFLTQKINEKTPRLYRGSLKGPSKTPLLKNVQTPSVSS